MTQRDFQIRIEDQYGEEEILCFTSEEEARKELATRLENEEFKDCLIELIEVLEQYNFK